PNILVVITDDQANSLFNRDLMPNVFSKIVDRGVLFDQAYVNTSQCCPSRAQILTGLFAHHNGVDGNSVDLLHPTMVELLQDEGYRTMLAGKCLNSWPCKPRWEFQVLACIRGLNRHPSLRDPVIHRDGVAKRKRGYQTEILADILAREIAATPADQPFAAIYSPTSPHMPANDDRYRSMPVAPYRPPNFDRAPEGGTAPPYATRDPLSAEEIAKIDLTYRKMARSTRALDDSRGRLIDSLGPRAENTIVFFLSDNGYMYGEHRLRKKVAPYEESVRVPFAISYPGYSDAVQGAVSSSLVQNVDIAPTVAELVGREWSSDGVSLLPLLSTPQAVVRDAALIENCQASKYPCYGIARRGSRTIPSYWAVVSNGFKYIEYLTGHKALFDLANDPHELNNLTGNDSYAAIKEAMARRLLLFRQPPPVDTTIVSGPEGSISRQKGTFRYFSHDRASVYLCRMTVGEETSAWQLCDRFTHETGTLEPGSYVFEVAAQDKRGLTDPSPARQEFEILPRD
ncbi:MAG: sulfatase-like hydrolase/transferase, partial [Actinomycetota bacterium]